MKSKPGTYALILEAAEAFELAVGKLGFLKGPAGYYLYCGSAFGPGGVLARTSHHRRFSWKPHWHIDYLKSIAVIREIWFSHDPVKREHDWVGVLLKDNNTTIPFPGFGSSDCVCQSHLLFSEDKPSYYRFIRTVHHLFEKHQTVSRFVNPV